MARRKKKTNNFIKKIIIILLLFGIIKMVCVKNNYYLPIINEKINIKLNIDKYYLAVDDTYVIESNLENVKWTSSDDKIATVKDGLVKGLKDGNVDITASIGKNKSSVHFTITSLIKKKEITEKTNIKCNQFSNDENKLLDEILLFRVQSVGYKTRASVVEAARFLTLEFPYTIEYFYENGRLRTNGNRRFVDGEGRYYHQGLYLSKEKFNELRISDYGPSIWGCNLYERVRKEKFPNGLDCSGFVTWAMLNGGFDPGDVGAGAHKSVLNDLDDLGKKVNLKNDIIKDIKVGDLIGFSGHIGIIIGIDGEDYYIAESYTDKNNLHVDKLNKEKLLKSNWKYVMLMDDYYTKDGNLTNIWFTKK